MCPPIENRERIRALLTFYRETHYDAVRGDGRDIHLRVGEPLPVEAREWLAGATHGAFLTACNPYSQALPAERNAARLAALRADLAAAGVGHLPGESWREPSVLAADFDIELLDRLARRYEQNALLVLRPDEPVRLRLYRPEWRELVGTAVDLEWA